MHDFQIFTSVIVSIFFIVVFVLIRRDAILMGAAFRWFAIAFITLILGFFPSITDIAAESLGIAYSPILPVVLACMILLIKSLLADIERAKSRVKMDRLAQRMAILESKLKQQ
ncbi:DUF2304 domain-containing protein [Catenovulum sp. SM1970]|uniref:DUF2304 family protein n=1 Tax=Marinifaba aquimaris TaxID=2741323 RepID=UPI0015724E39|nr:DUF2304 domain-containing protein [Marinifaba aquimaris]